MEINVIKQEAIVEKSVVLSVNDMFVIGSAFPTIHKLVENHREVMAFTKADYDKRDISKKPESISLYDKNIIDSLRNEMELVVKLVDQLSLKPEASNVFDVEDEPKHYDWMIEPNSAI